MKPELHFYTFDDLSAVLAARGMDITGPELVTVLKARGYLVGYGDRVNLPADLSVENGLMVVYSSARALPDGRQMMVRQALLTKVGLDLLAARIMNLMKEGGAAWTSK